MFSYITYIIVICYAHWLIVCFIATNAFLQKNVSLNNNFFIVKYKFYRNKYFHPIFFTVAVVVISYKYEIEIFASISHTNGPKRYQLKKKVYAENWEYHGSMLYVMYLCGILINTVYQRLVLVVIGRWHMRD